MSDSLVLLSGGVDSLVVLAQEVVLRGTPFCLTFDYGARHGCREIAAARLIARHYGARHRIMPIATLFGNSALTGTLELPAGLSLADPKQKVTVVPGRNLVLLALAGAVAVREKCKRVLFGANAGDAAIYADCRPQFVKSLDAAMYLSQNVAVEAPFLHLPKSEIVKQGRALDAPLHMAWSCYAGGEVPCRECGACLAASEAGLDMALARKKK